MVSFRDGPDNLTQRLRVHLSTCLEESFILSQVCQIDRAQAANRVVEVRVAAEIHDDMFGEPRRIARPEPIMIIEGRKRRADEVEE